MGKIKKILHIERSDLNYRLQEKEHDSEEKNKGSGKEKSRKFKMQYNENQQENKEANFNSAEEPKNNCGHTEFSFELNRDLQRRRLKLTDEDKRDSR